MFKIAVIGAGQLGSRHLQGLKKADLEMAVYLVDPNEEALGIAIARYAEIEARRASTTLTVMRELSGLPPDLDLAIIATNSAVRAAIAEELMRTKGTRFLLFEKFLFPRTGEYTAIQQLLHNSGTKGWVNCPRRMYPAYRELAKTLKGPVRMEVFGGEWGLGCNAIHFLDIFAMLVRPTDLSIEVSGLDLEIQHSKRAGYVEFTGSVTGETDNGSKIVLRSQKGDTTAPVITLHTADAVYTIWEGERKMERCLNDGSSVQTLPFDFFFQSDLTGLIIETIIGGQTVPLTTYEESAGLHLKFLTPVIEFYNQKTGLVEDYCPIT